MTHDESWATILRQSTTTLWTKLIELDLRIAASEGIYNANM